MFASSRAIQQPWNLALRTPERCHFGCKEIAESDVGSTVGAKPRILGVDD